MSRYPIRWVVLVAVVASILGGALWWADTPPRDRSSTAAGPVPATNALSSATRVLAPARARPAVDVLHHWDRARARAYATGDLAGLRDLYVAGSIAGTTDARILHSYLRRGLHVDRMRMQLLAVTVLARSPDRWRLRVTDRLTGAVAVGHGAHEPLPRDEASTHVVTLRRGSPATTGSPDGWLVVSVQ